MIKTIVSFITMTTFPYIMIAIHLIQKLAVVELRMLCNPANLKDHMCCRRCFACSTFLA